MKKVKGEIMKIKSRNLLTAILALLCAVTVALGITFALPKNRVNTAQAAVAVTPTITFGALQYYGENSQSLWSKTVTESDFSTTVPSYVTYSSTANSITTSTIIHGTDYAISTALAVQINMSINVPAHTVYSVKYQATYSISGLWSTSCTTYDSWNTNISDGFTYITGGSVDTTLMSGVLGGGPTMPAHDVGTYPRGNTVLFYNDTNSSKTMSLYNYVLIHSLDAGDSQSIGTTYVSSFSFDSFNVEAAKIDVPTTTDITPKNYDGANKTFNFTYDAPTVTAGTNTLNYVDAYNNIDTTVEAKYYDGTTILSSTYNLSALAVNRTLTAKEAGTYKVKFNFTSAAISNGVTWSDGSIGEKTLTFTINRKPIAVPTISNPIQPYRGTEYEFGLSGFDKTLMSVPVGGYTSNNGSNISWDNTAGAEKLDRKSVV